MRNALTQSLPIVFTTILLAALLAPGAVLFAQEVIVKNDTASDVCSVVGITR